MRKSALTSQRVFAIVLIGTAIVAMLPTHMLRGWTSDVAEIVKLVTTPLEHAGSVVRAWLRPVRPAIDGQPITGDVHELIEQLTIERDRERDLRRQQELLNLDLQRRLDEVRRIGIDDFPLNVRLLDSVPIYAHSPDLGVGTVEINRGARHGVRPGSVAVFRSDLVGQVISVRRLRSTIRPISSPNTGTLLAMVFPADQPGASPSRDREVLLEPQGRGRFTATIDRNVDVSIGDLVRHNDPNWHPSARGMIVGTVDAMEDIDGEPLRRRLMIRVRFRPHELPLVILKVPGEE